MERLENQINKELVPDQMESLRYDDCGVINCRSKLKRSASVRDEIQAIIDERTSGGGLLQQQKRNE